MPTRRELLRASLLGLAAAQLDIGATLPPQTLAEEGGRIHLPVGCAVSVPSLDDRPYADLVARQSTIVVAENAMKWARTHPVPDHFDFIQADRFVNFAKEHSLAMRGHNLCWHEYNPRWLDETANASNAAQILTAHIQTVAGRYAGQIHSWDVVNEAIKPEDHQPDGLRDSLWFRLLGPRYLEVAFQSAKEADPKALLTYNDYGIEYDSPEQTAKRAAVLALLRRLKDRNIPLDAVGIQSHLSLRNDATIGNGLRSFLRSVHDLSLKIMITELDVNGSSFSGSEQQRDKAVAAVYRNYLDLVLAEPSVSAVLTWGITDRYSWLNHQAETARLPAPRGLPFDGNLQPKPAYYAFLQALGSAHQGQSSAHTRTELTPPWKGYSILGNGNLTAVYSDDSRIVGLTHANGIQHLYFKDYTADYVASTSFVISQNDKPLEPAGTAAVGMKNFFTTQTRTPLPNGAEQTVLCFVHPDSAVVLSVEVKAASANASYKCEIVLRKDITTDQNIRLTSLRTTGSVAIAVWSNGTVLAVAPKSPADNLVATESSVSITGPLASESAHADVLLVPASSQSEALSSIRALQRKTDLAAEAANHWESWMNAGRLPAFPANEPQAEQYLEAYKRNLYCVKSANLNGQIPADITGQFVTNNMPQLYPRDAMMCARVLLLTGHTEEARQLIEFWAKRQIPMKTPGEWYARYDAHARAVDAGSGARFDEPEWDANGYYIYLLTEYQRLTGVWLADRELLYQLADFLVGHISPNGLLQEGGIVEWTGYLPATNMICAAALENAAKAARQFGEEAKAAAYLAAAQKISAALPQMFDTTRQTYADVRFTGQKSASGASLTTQSGEKTYLWDTTANVGAVWGYPNHRALELSNVFYSSHTVKLAGGMQYFDSPDPGLAGYGHDVFFFTTAAAAQYQCLLGNKSAAKAFLDWMLHNANSYGLMPERIFLNGADCSPASPLSWCCAEFAAALLTWSRL